MESQERSNVRLSDNKSDGTIENDLNSLHAVRLAYTACKTDIHTKYLLLGHLDESGVIAR